MHFSLASVKDKALSAKDAGVSKFRDTRDRYASTPESRTKFSEDGVAMSSKPAPAPPPPLRGASSNTRHTSGPPPIARATKPIHRFDPSPASSTPSIVIGDAEGDEDMIDWKNLSREDKQVFFAWLDEFFAQYLRSIGRPVPLSLLKSAAAVDMAHNVTEVRKSASPPPASTSVLANRPSRGPPPLIRAWSKPSNATSPIEKFPLDFTMSYPPPTRHGCAAADLASYFNPDTYWESAWYAEDNAKPPPLQNSKDLTWTARYAFHGNVKTMNIGVFFSDLSVCWAQITFNRSPISDPNSVQRHAEYLPRPAPLSKDLLVEAHETYGETIAAFAESFLGSGQFCARGECWDLASEALKHFSQYDYMPKPVPSLNRTHGHLLFEGKAMGKGSQVGRWHGGDDRVRRGDIVEWRSVTINFVGAPAGSWATLGDPEHTAVIVQDAVPSRAPQDGQSLLPSELVQLSVVEQSRNQPPEPKAKTYDMAAFEQGEVWIYRPIAMDAYLGVSQLTPTAPEGVSTLTV